MKHSPLRMEYIISYDIQDNKLRAQIFNELGKHGMRPVQKSVFWGFLTIAEHAAIRRYLNINLKNADKAFITRTNFNGKGKSYCIGYSKEDFQDWNETEVI